MPAAGADDATNRSTSTEGFREVRLPVDVVNVTLPNAKLRWLFVASNPVKAHSSGFKSNPGAIELLVNGTD
ncbi:hypothetical protein HEP73_04280 [Xanthomonas sp. GW]|nr:hypothetical protein HEP73_04280 [Xanthomonas sp. GW]